jgi:type IV secretory pathway VirB4 component
MAFGSRVPAHVATTRHLCAAYPLVSEAGLGHEGVLIGRDVLGGSFVYDPFDLYRRGVVTNPNMVVFGQIGRGKSSFVKSYLWRQAVFGRHAWVVDPKGEYGPLA